VNTTISLGWEGSRRDRGVVGDTEEEWERQRRSGRDRGGVGETEEE
jgi:hypothetical protein